MVCEHQDLLEADPRFPLLEGRHHSIDFFLPHWPPLGLARGKLAGEKATRKVLDTLLYPFHGQSLPLPSVAKLLQSSPDRSIRGVCSQYEDGPAVEAADDDGCDEGEESDESRDDEQEDLDPVDLLLGALLAVSSRDLELLHQRSCQVRIATHVLRVIVRQTQKTAKCGDGLRDLELLYTC